MAQSPSGFAPAFSTSLSYALNKFRSSTKITAKELRNAVPKFERTCWANIVGRAGWPMIPVWTAGSLALYTLASMQGVSILANAKHNRGVAAVSIDHLKLALCLTRCRKHNTSMIPLETGVRT